METRENLISLSENDLKLECKKFGEPEFRARQIKAWLSKGAQINEMTDLPDEFRRNLQINFTAFALKTEKAITDLKSGTKKYLYLCNDDIIIESVNLAYKYGDAQCISTQAGCAMHCVFCASGRRGLIRSLTWGEMLSQLLLAQNETPEKIKNIILMGSGEPLNNYSQTKAFLEKLSSEFSYSKRNLSLSTCGVIDGIRNMINDKLFVNLAISLHAPFHDMRLKLMPSEKKWPIDEVIKAANDYRKASGRRIVYEYAVIEKLNDTAQCASKLREITKGGGSLINLIAVNKSSSALGSTSMESVKRFSELLANRHVPHTVRRSLGSSINAACGQLSAYSLKP